MPRCCRRMASRALTSGLLLEMRLSFGKNRVLGSMTTLWDASDSNCCDSTGGGGGGAGRKLPFIEPGNKWTRGGSLEGKCTRGNNCCDRVLTSGDALGGLLFLRPTPEPPFAQFGFPIFFFRRTFGGGGGGGGGGDGSGLNQSLIGRLGIGLRGGGGSLSPKNSSSDATRLGF